MSKPTEIHKGKTPVRFHYIVEWAERRLVTPPGIAKAIGVERQTVYRWFAGQIPSEKHLVSLAEFFHIEPTDLFRHPDDNWLSRLLKDKPAEERQRIEEAIKIILKAS